MKKKILVLTLVVGLVAALSLGSLVYAKGQHSQGYAQKSRHGALSQLPKDKEMLFHSTMREVRDETQGMKEEIEKLRTEIKEILTAAEFDKSLFLKKTKEINKLRDKMHDVREKAIVKLATQFTQEERTVLAEMFPQGHGQRGRHQAR